MKKIILHIGMHKTGTSSIQHALQGMEDENFKYADFHHPNHSGPFYTAFSDEPAKYHSHRNLGRTLKEVNEIKNKHLNNIENNIVNCKSKTLIFSGEDLSGLSYSGVERVHDFFGKYCDNFEIVAYVRDPVSFSLSAFQQVVKGGLKNYKYVDPKYRFRFEKYIEIFGRDNIKFRLFDRENFPNKSVVSDFFNLVGLDFSKKKDVYINESLPLEVVKLLLIFNASGTASIGHIKLRTARDRFINWLKEGFNTPFVIPYSIDSDQLDHSDISWMESVSGFKLYQPHVGDALMANEITIRDWLSEINTATLMELHRMIDMLGIKYDVEEPIVSKLNRVYYHFLFDSSLGSDDVDALRDIALLLESHPDFGVNYALTLMELALRYRPEGLNIKNKVHTYKQLLK